MNIRITNDVICPDENYPPLENGNKLLFFLFIMISIYDAIQRISIQLLCVANIS